MTELKAAGLGTEGNEADSHRGRRILVTGCSSGIGRALTGELFSRGHHVVASARNLASLDNIRCSATLELDITSASSIDHAIHEAGSLDVLINNAGISIWGPVEAVPIEAAEKLFNTNFFGAMRMVNAVLPQMRAKRRGLIVQISSAAGRSTSPLVGYYSASKHALEAASEALRIELAAFGVRVSCISLGAVTSALAENRASFSSAAYTDIGVFFRNRLMAKRATPTSAEDAAKAIADCIDDDGAAFRYDATEDSRTIVAKRKSLTDAQYEAELLHGLTPT